jgi:NCS1 family nucleobase:cation symporter-1
MTFLPRFLNIKRGMYIAYVFGVFICPWKILHSASSFLAFLGGYSIFLGPFLGIFIVDYFVIRKGNIFIEDLYIEGGRYWYYGGVNWRAAVAYLFAVIWTLPGFAAIFGNTVPRGWLQLYKISWVFVCAVASVAYFAVCMIGDFCREERSMKFEQMYHEGRAIVGEEVNCNSGSGGSDIEVVGVSADKKA